VRTDAKYRAARQESETPAAFQDDSRPRARQRGGAAYVGAIVLLGCVVAGLSIVDLLSAPIDRDWLTLLALTVASGLATLRVPGMPISISISDIFSIAAALLFGAPAGALTSALDGLVLSFRMATSQRSLSRLLFNASAPAIAMWGAARAFAFLAGPRPEIATPAAAVWLLISLAVFGVIAFGLNTGIVALAVALERGVPVSIVWRQHFSGLWLNYLGGVFGGMLLMLLAGLHTPNVIILLIPLPVILYMAFRNAVGRTQDQISHLGNVNRVYVAAIEALAQAVDAKDQVTHDHVRRVQTRCVELARALGVDDEGELQAIKAASLLHDVGKLAIPEHILNKPGRLTPAEYEIMKRHAPIGADILSVIDFPYPVAPIVRHHHENWDGTGYPDGLAGDAIPVGARILSIVDCFDALTSDRPYRPRMDDEAALRVIAERKGTMYDPRVVDAFFAFQGVEVRAAPAAVKAPDGPQAPHAAEGAASISGDSELQAFFRLGRALDRTGVTEAIAIVRSHLAPHLPEATMVVYASDASVDAIVVVAESGARGSGLQTGEAVPIGDRLSGWVAATGESVMNSDARLDFDERGREHSPFRSALAVPIRSHDGIVGVLSAYAIEVDAFEERHRRIMQAAAEALVTSLDAAIAGRRGMRRVS
jgi:putative nucleotidyltransferase with HDIG domain